MTGKCFRRIDNAPLVLFRIFFGLLLAAEAFGAILTGWLRKNFIEPRFTFSYIGLEWLRPLPGNGMYFYFAAMGLLGIAIMLGYRYRLSLGIFTLLWTGSYLMQKSSYNNHYYLLLLVCIIMLFLPAGKYGSLDARRNPGIKSCGMPQWCSWVLMLQIAIVYFFAAVSKCYSGWLDGTFIGIMLRHYAYFPFLEPLFSQKAFHVFLAYAGLFFDLLVIPMFLYKKTRTLALLASVIFHGFNAVFLQIGIFPFFALSFVVFFYEPDQVRRWFFPKKPPLTGQSKVKGSATLLSCFFIPYFLLQLALPLRHYFIKGDVLWTEEGHRLSWRMMLREKTGSVSFKVVDRKTNIAEIYKYWEKLTPKQRAFVSSKPDGMWQMAQMIKKEYHDKGRDVAIFINSGIRINGKSGKKFIDPNVDFATAKWDYFFHNDWILLYDEQGKRITGH